MIKESAPQGALHAAFLTFAVRRRSNSSSEMNTSSRRIPCSMSELPSHRAHGRRTYRVFPVFVSSKNRSTFPSSQNLQYTYIRTFLVVVLPKCTSHIFSTIKNGPLKVEPNQQSHGNCDSWTLIIALLTAPCQSPRCTDDGKQTHLGFQTLPNDLMLEPLFLKVHSLLDFVVCHRYTVRKNNEFIIVVI
ncbi:MAG: hypothetical protein RIQ41_542 [Candidatus Parcubacteria bacterium]